MPPAVALDRLRRDVLGVVGDRYRDGPDRHRRLRSAVAWTIAQLDRPARRLFERLEVVEGSFDLEYAALPAEGLAAAPPAAATALVDLHPLQTGTAHSPAGHLRSPPPLNPSALTPLNTPGAA